MTAIQWLGRGTQTGFAPEQFQQACDFLAIPDSLRSQIRHQIDAMKARLHAPGIEPVGRDVHLAEEVQSVKESVDARLVRMRERSRSEPPKANP